MDELILLFLAAVMLYYHQAHFDLEPSIKNSNRGPELIAEWLERPKLLFKGTGLQHHTFLDLIAWIRQETALDDTRYMRLEEKVAIFLHLCHQGAGYINTGLQFGRAPDTISRYAITILDLQKLTKSSYRCFNSVLNTLVLLHYQTVRQPMSTDPIPEAIHQNPKLWPYFKDCIGAIDGTHIHAHIPAAEQAAWRNRKGFISQNVFAACSFDLQFTFIHAGWQGSAHDSLVLKDALAKQRFKPPANRYYVADAGFYNCDFMLIPYAKTRYHLREYAKAQLRPETKEELFNLRHAQLRNAIKRIFGVIKRKFKILLRAPEYSIKQQIQLVLGLTALHNFIAIRDRNSDIDFQDLEEFDTWVNWCPIPPPSYEARATTAKTEMGQLRDSIAEQMWADYQDILRGRGQI